jgi:hypothetical protein
MPPPPPPPPPPMPYIGTQQLSEKFVGGLFFERLITNPWLQRIYRVPGFLSCRPNWLPPPPQPQASVAIPPFGFRRGGHTRLRERGRGRPIPIPTKGQTLWYSRYSTILLQLGCSIYFTSSFLRIVCYVMLSIHASFHQSHFFFNSMHAHCSLFSSFNQFCFILFCIFLGGFLLIDVTPFMYSSLIRTGDQPLGRQSR